MRIAITGSSGLIGTALSRRLNAEGHDVVAVVRRQPNDKEIGWSVAENRIDDNAFDGIDAVAHLAGAGIGDHRWTDDHKRELLDSRTVGTALIAEGVRSASRPPSVLLSVRRSASTARARPPSSKKPTRTRTWRRPSAPSSRSEPGC